MNVTIILSIISTALCIFMFIYLKWYIKQRTSETGVLKETNQKVKKWINEVDLSITEINAVTDRNLLLIEDKIKKLNELLEDTDKRISVYIKEVEKSRASEALYTQLGRGVRAAIKDTSPMSPPSAPLSAPVPAPALSLVRPNLHPIQQTLPLDDIAPAPKKETAEPQKPPSKKQIRANIDQLANEGFSEQQIASRLGISIAEVDLAMQLRRK